MDPGCVAEEVDLHGGTRVVQDPSRGEAQRERLVQERPQERPTHRHAQQREHPLQALRVDRLEPLELRDVERCLGRLHLSTSSFLGGSVLLRACEVLVRAFRGRRMAA